MEEMYLVLLYPAVTCDHGLNVIHGYPIPDQGTWAYGRARAGGLINSFQGPDLERSVNAVRLSSTSSAGKHSFLECIVNNIQRRVQQSQDPSHSIHDRLRDPIVKVLSGAVVKML